MESKNMELWDKVSKTDPDTTRQVNQRGGFTAIAAQSQRKKATEIWGAYGKGWKLDEMVWGEVRSNGEMVELTLEAVFVYPEGSFQVSSDIAYRPGNDCRKKLMTDVTTKALSLLGFNSDVFEGKFDDNKYVAGLKQEKAQTGEKEKCIILARQIFEKIQKAGAVPKKYSDFMARIETRTVPEIKGFLKSADTLINKTKGK